MVPLGFLAVYQITTFLLALAILLGFARILGEVARRFHQPAILGEILAGILLGPTVFGAFFPELMGALFPLPTPEAVAQGDVSPVAFALDGLVTISIVLFLMVAGMEVDLNVALRQGKPALAVSVAGIAFPFALGFAAIFIAPGVFGFVADEDASGSFDLLIFALFFATALSITALPVIAKILMDLNLFKTDMGMIVIASAIVNDLLGWMIFAVVLGLIGAGKGLAVQYTLLLTVLFAVFLLTIGRWLIHRCLPYLQAHISWPAGVLAFAITCAILCAAATEAIGIHAIFGSFLFGIAIGDSRYLRERTRTTIDQFISSVFAPIFFASIGLHVNFIENFNLVLVVAVLVIATIGKVLGCGLMARFVGLPKQESWAIGVAMNARGAMEIILGLLALQVGLINQELFVALVIMALVTSMTSGSLMQRILKRTKPIHYSDYLSGRNWRSPLEASTREGVIRELSELICRGMARLDPEAISAAVLAREEMMPTGIGRGVAIPHARIDDLDAPIIAVGISPDGVDFDAPDGAPARVVFLILTPRQDNGAQLQILAGISRHARKEQFISEITKAESYTVMLARVRSLDTE